MELKEYNEISEALDKAEEDTTPFMVVTDQDLNVVGDANKTEINKHDYKVAFRIYKDGKYEWVEKEFKDVYITPRNDVKVSRMLTQLMPYFKKIEDGKTKKYEKEEILDILTQDTILDAMYDTVAAVLSIPDNLKDLMAPESVIQAAAQIIKDYPEAVNEADTFFGKSSGRM